MITMQNMSSAKDTLPVIPNYQILSKISEGGMATVYLAVQKNLDRKVALKIMSPAFISDMTLRDSFIKEGKIIASLSHPHIITIHDIGMANQHYYMSMEYMPGATLKEKISEGLTTDKSIMIIEQLAKALGYAHYRDFIHRDIKPGNVLFRHPGHVILTDFGVAKAKKTTTDLTRLGYMVGTPHYMSPEQANGKKIDHRSDIYSLGVLFYEILTQKKPFTADDTMAIAYKHVNEPIPPLPLELSYLQNLMDKLLAKEPQQRFQNAREFITDLKNCKNDSTRIMPTRRINAIEKGKSNTKVNLTGLENNKGLLSTFKNFFGSEKIPASGSHNATHLERTIRQMQDRQASLEEQLETHKTNADDLKKELLVAKRNNRAISKKTLSRLNQLDEKVKPQLKKIKIDDQKIEIEIEKDAPPTTQLPPIDDEIVTSPPLQVKKLTAKTPLNDHLFPELLIKPSKNRVARVNIISPDISGRVQKLVTVEPASSLLLLGQLIDTELSDKIHINGQLCHTVLDGHFCLKFHLKPKTDTNLTISITSNDNEVTVTHKLRQLSFTSDNQPQAYTPTLTSVHNHALIIGNTHYEHFPDCDVSTADAYRLNKLLSEKFQFQTTCLVNATKNDLLEGLNKIYSKFSKDDTLIVFYSGLSHILDSNEEGYWIPVDGDKIDHKTWVSNRYFSGILQLFPAKHILIMTDSSFTAASKQKIKLKSLLKGNSKTLVPRSSASSGTVISSGCNEPQNPGIDNTRHSLFGGGIINILECADTLIGTKELYAELKTYAAKFRLDRKNKPRISYSVLDGHHAKNNNFFLKPSRKK